MHDILVIGYGNTLRGDDAAGVRAAEMLQSRMADLDVVTVTDLSIELAAPMAHHDQVIFIDASAGGDSVRLRTIDGTTPPPAIKPPPAHIQLIKGKNVILSSAALSGVLGISFSTSCKSCRNPVITTGSAYRVPDFDR